MGSLAILTTKAYLGFGMRIPSCALVVMGCLDLLVGNAMVHEVGFESNVRFVFGADIVEVDLVHR